jgi:diphthamide synthase (EF-2-diphthine--ammonia ligase)
MSWSSGKDSMLALHTARAAGEVDVVGLVLAEGVRAVITCVDPRQAPASLAGRWYDHDLLARLPPEVDPRGENGEFHTFVVDGPGFPQPLDVAVGATVERDGFVFTDVVPTSAASSGRGGIRPG